MVKRPFVVIYKDEEGNWVLERMSRLRDAEVFLKKISRKQEPKLAIIQLEKRNE